MRIVLGLLKFRDRFVEFARLEVKFTEFKPHLQIVRIPFSAFAALFEFVSLLFGLDTRRLLGVVWRGPVKLSQGVLEFFHGRLGQHPFE